MLENENGQYSNHDASNRLKGEHSGVISYLAELGLTDSDLAKVARLLNGINGRESPLLPPASGQPLDFGPDELMALLQGENLLAGALPDEPAGDTLHPGRQPNIAAGPAVQLYVAEEQQVLKEAYRSFFSFHPSFDMLGLSGDTSHESLRAGLAGRRPNVIMLGLKAANMAMGDTLESIRALYPEVGLVLLFALYDSQGIRVLREYSNNANAGYAYLLKHNIDTADQLAQVVSSVAQGRIIVDPEVMEGLVDVSTAENKVMAALSPKELQVLSWMARGFANEAIAGVLVCDRRAVERQISNIYSKLQLGDDQRDPRVGAALMYLQATGLLTKS